MNIDGQPNAWPSYSRRRINRTTLNLALYSQPSLFARKYIKHEEKWSCATQSTHEFLPHFILLSLPLSLHSSWKSHQKVSISCSCPFFFFLHSVSFSLCLEKLRKKITSRLWCFRWCRLNGRHTRAFFQLIAILQTSQARLKFFFLFFLFFLFFFVSFSFLTSL